jgi:adenosylcobinamide-GDP ribazoletransferase
MRRFLDALQFLTIIRLPKGLAGEGFKEGTLAAAAPFFPLVGVLIAVLSFFAAKLAALIFPWRMSVLVLMASSVALSGALHLDGLSDFCDGFFSPRSGRWEILKIMKDSRIGVMGTLGVVFVILAKYELLVLTAMQFFLVLFVFAASRAVQVVFASLLPYVGDEMGMGKTFVGKIAPRDVAVACMLPLAIGLPLGWRFLAVEIFSLTALVGLLAMAVKRRLGGTTGDVLGAASELSEILVLSVAVPLLQS